MVYIIHYNNKLNSQIVVFVIIDNAAAENEINEMNIFAESTESPCYVHCFPVCQSSREQVQCDECLRKWCR